MSGLLAMSDWVWRIRTSEESQRPDFFQRARMD
jgi:hypothetical protein